MSKEEFEKTIDKAIGNRLENLQNIINEANKLTNEISHLQNMTQTTIPQTDQERILREQQREMESAVVKSVEAVKDMLQETIEQRHTRSWHDREIEASRKFENEITF